MISQSTSAIFRLFLLCVVMLLLVGCGSSGRLIVERRGDGAQVLESQFDEVTYRYEDDNGATFVMLRGSADAPEAAATIRLFWRPQPGSTPMDATATNATMHYVLFADDGTNLAIYSGAGFLLTSDRPGEMRFKGKVTGATLRLSEQTPGFGETVGRADLHGNFAARRDDSAASDMIQQINRHVRQRLGRARLVDASPQH